MLLCWPIRDYGFSIVMYWCESQTIKRVELDAFVMVLKKTLEIPLESKETKAVNPKGNKFWIFIRMTVAEAKAPILWSPDAKSWLIKKDPGTGKYWTRRRMEWERVRWLVGITDSMDMSLSNLWEIAKEREVWHATVLGVAKCWTLLSD